MAKLSFSVNKQLKATTTTTATGIWHKQSSETKRQRNGAEKETWIAIAKAKRESHLNCDQTNRQVTHNECAKRKYVCTFPSEGQKMTPKCGWILFLVLFVPNYIETGEYIAISSCVCVFFSLLFYRFYLSISIPFVCCLDSTASRRSATECNGMECSEMFWFASFHVQTNKNEMGQQERTHYIQKKKKKEEEVR